jgi:hypothetical protein
MQKYGKTLDSHPSFPDVDIIHPAPTLVYLHIITFLINNSIVDPIFLSPASL